MGLFDSVMVKCPNCGKENEFQSKSGKCNLDYYTLKNCPNDVFININRHAPIKCECGTFYMVDVKERKQKILKMKKKGKELEFISWIKRDGSGTVPIPTKWNKDIGTPRTDDMSYLDETVFDILPLSRSKNTLIASNINSWIVRIKSK